jgi:tyrosinase
MVPRTFSEAIKLLLYISIFTTLSTCSPITPRIKRQTLEDISQNQKRQDGFFSVLGVAGLTGSDSHPRLEIRELEKNEDQWNVYLLGLQRFQSVDQSDKLSYYQITRMILGGGYSNSFPRTSGSQEFDFLDFLVA